MYFPDLTPYQYSGEQSQANVLNVGWLSKEHAYPQGGVPGQFVEALRRLVANPVNLYRGTHLCEFCPEPPSVVREGLRWAEPAPGTTGNGEVRVGGANGVIYVAPVLALHYVQAHGYLPPPEFVAAVLESDGAA